MAGKNRYKPEPDEPEEELRRRLELELDEGLEGTFPASDPVSVTVPASGPAANAHAGKAHRQRPTLEHVLETEDFGIEVLHPGGLEITRELAELCAIGDGTAVLDVASGTGESACFLAERYGARLVGIDISDNLIARAKAKAAQRKLPIEFSRGDARRLEFSDDTFNVAISECTMCLLDKERALAEMARVVRPGGRVGMHDICWKAGAPDEMKRRLAELEGERPETLGEWPALFERAGLIDVRAIDKPALLGNWISDIRRTLGLGGLISAGFEILRSFGICGALGLLEAERILRSAHVGYGIVVGRKPERRAL